MAILNNSNAISSGGYDINNSLRFRSSASAYLSRTPASASNRTTMTFSAWVKRGALGANQSIFNARATSSPYSLFHFYSNDTLVYEDSNTAFLQTTQVFRDPSAWYHIVFVLDTTQATAANRVKIYVNGSQVTALSTATYPAQNANTNYNTATAHAISSQTPSFSNEFFDGYMTEVNFVDGQALTPSSFGETDTDTGSWKPKAYTGTYGTNGFYLKGRGTDNSGNGNNWTENNFNTSNSALVTYDIMTDSPTLTSATVANYCVLNPLMNYGTAPASITNANLTATSNASGSNGTSILGTIAVSSGKWYWEYVVSSAIVAGNTVGIVGTDFRPNFQSDAYFDFYANGYGYKSNGQKGNNNTNTSYGASFTNGDVIGVALDLDAGTIVFYKNNTSQGTAFSGISGTFYPAIYGYSSSVMQINFGQRPFSYTPPTGFVRLNTYNLPDSTIKKGNTVMDATLYTGNLTGQSITNAAAFKPDLVWIKSRSAATDHKLTDSVRGTTKAIVSNSTAAETTDVTGMTAFNTNGFTLGASTTYNNTGVTYVGWQWQAGQSSGSSNTSGTITSTVSVNTTAGFSVVTYTVPSGGASFTVGHGLGVAPKMIITKNRGGTSPWPTWVTGFSKDQYLNLNTTAATASQTDYWGSAVPTSTVFGNKEGVTWNSGATIVAYCWAEIAGFSKFGSYTGNGSADGTFVYTGFRPKYVLIKANAVYQWLVWDSVRTTYNIKGKYFLVDLSNAEDTFDAIDFVSNGFKIRVNHPAVNTSGTTYIYMAFAENPFKNANAA